MRMNTAWGEDWSTLIPPSRGSQISTNAARLIAHGLAIPTDSLGQHLIMGKVSKGLR
jgi:hypothetical protein